MSYIGAIISTTGYILLFSLFLTGCASGSLCERMGCQLEGNPYFDSDEFKGKVYYSNDGMDDGRSLKERLETLERYRDCQLGVVSECEGQFHWGGSPYYRIEQLEQAVYGTP